jgi:hypothetical protein
LPSFAAKTHNRVARHLSGVDQLSADCVGTPAQEVADNSIPTLVRNNHAHPADVGWALINNDEDHYALASPPHNLPKVVRRNDSVVALKHRVWLDGDLAAAFATTSGQDCAPGASAHAQAETVNLGSAAIVGLIGALGHCVLLGE